MSASKLIVALFIFLSSISGFIIGALISPFFIPENSGLVGGALVFWYAILGMLLGLIIGIVVWRFCTTKQLKIANWVMAVFSLAMIGWFSLNMFAAYREGMSDLSELPKTTKPIPSSDSEIAAPIEEPEPEFKVSIGLGMAEPAMNPNQTILLYQEPNEEAILDSLIFEEGPYHLIIKEASNSINPEVNKLDYQMCYFLWKSQKNGFLEIVLDKNTGQRAWVKSDFMTAFSWPRFLTSIHSVEPRDMTNNPVRMSPSDDAKAIEGLDSFSILQAKAVTGDWLLVNILDGNYQAISKGYIRWRKNGELILDYNLLS